MNVAHSLYERMLLNLSRRDDKDIYLLKEFRYYNSSWYQKPSMFFLPYYFTNGSCLPFLSYCELESPLAPVFMHSFMLPFHHYSPGLLYSSELPRNLTWHLPFLDSSSFSINPSCSNLQVRYQSGGWKTLHYNWELHCRKTVAWETLLHCSIFCKRWDYMQ